MFYNIIQYRQLTVKVPLSFFPISLTRLPMDIRLLTSMPPPSTSFSIFWRISDLKNLEDPLMIFSQKILDVTQM